MQQKNPVYPVLKTTKVEVPKMFTQKKKKYLYIHASSHPQVGAWMSSTRVPRDFMYQWTFYESIRYEVLPGFVTTKSTVICNVTMCSFVHIPVFWRNMQPPYPIQKIRHVLLPWRWGQQFLPKRFQRSSFYRLRDETVGLQSRNQFYWTHSINFTEFCMYINHIQTQKLTSPLADLYPCHSLDHSWKR